MVLSINIKLFYMPQVKRLKANVVNEPSHTQFNATKSRLLICGLLKQVVFQSVPEVKTIMTTPPPPLCPISDKLPPPPFRRFDGLGV